MMLLAALTMLVAPFAQHSAAAMPMAAGDHHMPMAQAGHCSDDGQQSEPGDKAGMTCCAATCAAAALTPVTALDLATFTASEPSAKGALFARSFLAELPTPPPRVA